MEALRKHAHKLKGQVTKQQQAVMKQFGGTGYESSDVTVTDDVEFQIHQQIEKLYKATREGKDFQKDIVRAAEAFTAIGCKDIEIGTKLSEDCCKYGSEHINDEILAKAASVYGNGRIDVKKEQEELNGALSSQILEPLKAMITGAPLENARQLAQRYSRLRHEAETQVAEVARRQARAKEMPTPETAAKLEAAESKMQELIANLSVLGKEAISALTAVEDQQKRLTFQRLVAMVGGEKSYHERVAALFRRIEAEMVSEKQVNEGDLPSVESTSNSEHTKYFLAEATHAFSAGSEKELSLAVGDYVVVRQVAPSGWSEGECEGHAGWFPSAFVVKRENVPTSNDATAQVF